MHEILKKKVTDALSALGIDGVEPVLEFPAELPHGDFATNAALAAAKAAGMNPKELAEKIVSELGEIDGVEKIEVAGPGFINFHLSREYFSKTVSEVNGDWGKGELLSGKKVMVEYTDPNPFKELHIGHLVPNALGEALARLSEFSGAETRRVTFQGDVGMHVAKAMWGLQQSGVTTESNFTAEDLGKAYAKGATAFEEDENAQKEIKELNKKIYAIFNDESKDIADLYYKARDVSVEYFETGYEILGSKFDHYFFESVTGQLGAPKVREHIGDVFKESDGAVIFPGEEYGLHTRVFINSEGLPTYEAKDIGLIYAKKEWWPADVYITVTGSEIKDYFAVVIKALEQFDAELAQKIKLSLNGMLRLSTGKMSSRTGNVIPALSLIAEVSSATKERMQDSDMSDEEKEKVAQQTAVAAIKYAILKNTAGKDIVFDVKKSISVEGDSGPYLQYSYARARSVLGKAGSEGSTELALELTPEFERLLPRFPMVVERAASEYEPHYVTTYLTELASAFNSWYAQEKIIGTEDEAYKLALTNAFAQTMKNGLWLLGIEAPEKM